MNGLLSQIANVEANLATNVAWFEAHITELTLNESEDWACDIARERRYLEELRDLHAQDEDRAANPEAYMDDASLYYERMGELPGEWSLFGEDPGDESGQE